jgi:hypothetical protein
MSTAGDAWPAALRPEASSDRESPGTRARLEQPSLFSLRLGRCPPAAASTNPADAHGAVAGTLPFGAFNPEIKPRALPASANQTDTVRVCHGGAIPAKHPVIRFISQAIFRHFCTRPPPVAAAANVKMGQRLQSMDGMVVMVPARWRSGYARTVQGPQAWFKSKPGLQFPPFVTARRLAKKRIGMPCAEPSGPARASSSAKRK